MPTGESSLRFIQLKDRTYLVGERAWIRWWVQDGAQAPVGLAGSDRPARRHRHASARRGIRAALRGEDPLSWAHLALSCRDHR